MVDCDCKQDGYCERYGREMGGRFREICQGINVDLGTAAVFREQWAKESLNGTDKYIEPRHLLLKADQAPGDMVSMTAAIYSLHKAHPGKFKTAVESLYPDVFAHNPDVVSVDSLDNPSPLHMHYASIHQSNDRAIHFMQAWCEHISAALNINVPLATNRPRLYFTDPEPTQGNYWLVCSGGKNDFTAKLWGYDNYQKVVELLRGKIKFVQVGSEHDNHQRLLGTGDMVGATNLRQLFDLVRRCKGVLCGTSLLMHVAAALNKPAVVVAGGREPVAWNAYPRQQYVHTVGALQCRSTQGHIGEACWRSRTVPLNDGTMWDVNPCEQPENGTPACMRLITPTHVSELIIMLSK